MMRAEILRRAVRPSLKRPAPHRRVAFALPRRLFVKRIILKCVAESRNYEAAPRLKDALSLQVALLTSDERLRADEQNDALFYSVPRFVQYVDEQFTDQVTNWYDQHLKEGDDVLDLCAAYDSHLPEMRLGRVVGHGMSAPELASNPVLDSYFVKDLNVDPSLTTFGTTFDVVLCCMGMPYLKYPEDVCHEVYRILKPGGRFLISFTSHCFPEKTITGWIERTLDERFELVKKVLQNVGFADVEGVTCAATSDDPDVISDSVLECADGEMCSLIDFPRNSTECLMDFGSDPFYGIVGTKCSAWNVSPSEVLMGAVPLHLDILNELDLPTHGLQPPYQKHNRAISAYRSLCRWAISIGVPKSAVWLPDEFETLESLKEKRDYMKDMIASFVSSGL